jgi:hypothetical protein
MSDLAPQDAELFPVVRACQIERETVSESWLIEDLWTRSAVGWVAGQPKSLKSWTALEMAVSVSSGTPCLRRYKVQERGAALVYLAEDSLPAVRERLEALSSQRALPLDALDLHVITAGSMRLDRSRDQLRLQKTARLLAPRLLVLDPLIRIHRADENSSGEVSGLLAYLRELQRELDLAVVVVHHVRKNAGSSQTVGQALRGSSDLHAWSDSALYLRRKGDDVLVTIEHRSAPAPAPITLRLADGSGPPRLQLLEGEKNAPGKHVSVEERIFQCLKEASPLTRSGLRERLSMRNERLSRALERLQEARLIERTTDGWQLSPTPDPDRSPFPSIGMNGNGTGGGPPELPNDTF